MEMMEILAGSACVGQHVGSACGSSSKLKVKEVFLLKLECRMLRASPSNRRRHHFESERGYIPAGRLEYRGIQAIPAAGNSFNRVYRAGNLKSPRF